MPAHQDDQTDETGLGIQRQQRFLQVGQHTVEQDLPDVAQQDAADQVGHEVDGTEDVGAADAAGEHQRDGEGAHIDEHGAYHRKGSGEPKGVEEGRVRKDVDVVLQAHEGGLAHGGETLEGKIDAPDEGPDEADDERQQGGQYEHRPIFTDGLLHDIPPEKEGEAGEHIARLPVIQLLRKKGNA